MGAMRKLCLLICFLLSLSLFGAPGTRLTVQVNSAETGKPIDRASVIVKFRHGLNPVKMKKMITNWETKAAHGGKKAIVNLGGIRGGHAWRASRTPEKTDLFLDVRVPPTIPMNQARRDIHQLFLELQTKHPDYGLEFETYVSVPGARIDESHTMIQAIEANHERIMGKSPEREVVTWCSDASVLSRYGVETVNYGPSSGPRDKEGEKVKIQTLVDITKIYALTAAELCEVTS